MSWRLAMYQLYAADRGEWSLMELLLLLGLLVRLLRLLHGGWVRSTLIHHAEGAEVELRKLKNGRW